MPRLHRATALLIVSLLCLCWNSQASMHVPLTTEQHVHLAQAICRGTVLRIECFKERDGHVYTRTQVRVDEVFKGQFPSVVVLTHRGGTWGGLGETDDSAPQFQVSEERLLFLSRRRNGTLGATEGGASALSLQRAANGFIPSHAALLEEVRRQAGAPAVSGNDVTDQAGDPAAIALDRELGAVPPARVTGLLVDNAGVSSRFLAPDRGEPIPYLVDADSMPAGFTLHQALDAIRTAMAAWTAVTGVKFRFEGLQSFGTAAANAGTDDGRVRIQLHDNYGYLASSTALALGGRHYLVDPVPSVNWYNGGNVASNEFYESSRAYIVIKHIRPQVQNLTTFTEVICHEVGHALSLAHSSETPNEPNLMRREAIMYYVTHADGRGATLGSYEPPIVRQVHPPGNTPPYTYPRVMDIITLPSGAPAIPGVNEIQLRGYDLQSTNLILATANATAGSGTFSLLGDRLKFAPRSFFRTDRLDPAATSYYDRIAVRYTDGTNASPPVYVRVISHNPDTFPSPGGDGLPDGWMNAYWGNANPATGPQRNAGDDFDGDGLTNVQEYWVGTSPIDAGSRLDIYALSRDSFRWDAKPYELYEIESSTNLESWTRVLNPVFPTGVNGVATDLTQDGSGQQFFRLLKVP